MKNGRLSKEKKMTDNCKGIRMKWKENQNEKFN